MHARPIVVTAALLGLGIGLVPQVLPAHAAPQAQPTGIARAVPPPKPGNGVGWIQGTVADRAHRPILGVIVEAYEASDLSTPVASAETYESDYNGNRGWYRLYDLEPGRYKVRYASGESTRDDYKTVWSRVITVGERKIESRTQTLTLTQPVDARLTLEFDDASVKPSQEARLVVRLTSGDVKPIAGNLYVQIDAQRTWRTPIKVENNGRITLALPKQKVGKHTVSVTFGGNDAVRPSRGPVTSPFWVTRSGR